MSNETDPQTGARPRRQLIKALAAGGGVITSSTLLPSAWTRPVVDAVVLPSHAQTTCSPVDDEYFLNPGNPGASVPAPGVLANDSCSTVTGFSAPTVLQGGSVTFLNVNPDGSFNYTVTQPATRFSFQYTTENGQTATVIVNHDFNKPGP